MNLNNLLLEGSSVDDEEVLKTKKLLLWLKSIYTFASSFGRHIVFSTPDTIQAEIKHLRFLHEFLHRFYEARPMLQAFLHANRHKLYR